MAFGLAPQIVAQDSTVIYAESDSYQLFAQPTSASQVYSEVYTGPYLTEAEFQSLRDLENNSAPTAPPAVPNGIETPEAVSHHFS